MIVLPSLFFLILYVFYRKKNLEYFGMINILLLSYLTISVMGIICYYILNFPHNNSIATESMVYLLLCFLIVFIQIIKFKDNDVKAIVIENKSLYLIFENVMLLGSLCSLIYFIPWSIKSYFGDISLNRIEGSEIAILAKQGGLLYAIMNNFAYFYIVMQLMFFIRLLMPSTNISKIKSFLLLFSSFSYVALVMSYSGRDGFVFWAMSFYSLYLLFKKYLKKRAIKNFRKIIVAIIIVFFAFPFYYASKSRFGDSKEGTLTWIGYYLGQQTIIFNEVYLADGKISYGSRMFPLVTEKLKNNDLLPEKYFISPDELSDYYHHEGISINQFGTFIQSFLLDFGRIGTIFALLIFGYLIKRVIKRVKKSGSFNMSSILYFIFLYQIVFQGIFYFRLYAANWYIVELIVIIFAFKYNNGNESSRWIFYPQINQE